jgi:hypothetical protein
MNLDEAVIKSIKTSISEVVTSKLGGYNSPLDTVIKQVFEGEKDSIISILKEVFQEVIGSKEFKITIKEEFQRKVAKNLVGMLEGQVAQAANALKQDPTMKSRIILAIEKIVTETDDTKQ